MPAPRRPRPIMLRRQVYARRAGAWLLVGERDYVYPGEADLFCRAWPARVEKRQQSSTQHP